MRIVNIWEVKHKRAYMGMTLPVELGGGIISTLIYYFIVW